MPSDAFRKLSDFLLHRMRMSHIYQPLMLKVLLERGGRAQTRDIAAAFLAEDPSHIPACSARCTSVADSSSRLAQSEPGAWPGISPGTCMFVITRRNAGVSNWRLSGPPVSKIPWGSRIRIRPKTKVLGMCLGFQLLQSLIAGGILAIPPSQSRSDQLVT